MQALLDIASRDRDRRQGMINPTLDPEAPILGELWRLGYLEPAHDPLSDKATYRWLLGISALVHLAGYGRAIRLASLLAPRTNRSDAAPEDVVRHMKNQVEKRARQSWFLPLDCKAQSLTAYVLARRMGIQCVLKVGMRSSPLAMHAWAEFDDLSIPNRDPGGFEYAPILTLGA